MAKNATGKEEIQIMFIAGSLTKENVPMEVLADLSTSAQIAADLTIEHLPANSPRKKKTKKNQNN